MNHENVLKVCEARVLVAAEQKEESEAGGA